MSRLGETGIPTKSTDRQYALSMLRNTEVGGIDLAQMNLVPSLHERSKQVENEPATTRREEPFHVLEDESPRAVPRDEVCIDPHEGISLVVRLSPPGRREPLTGRASRNHVCIWENCRVVDGLRGDVVAKIGPVRVYSRSPAIDGTNGLKSGFPKPERQPSSTTEQVGNGRTLCFHGHSVTGFEASLLPDCASTSIHLLTGHTSPPPPETGMSFSRRETHTGA